MRGAIIALLLLLCLQAALECGYRMGRRGRRRDPSETAQSGTLQGSILGLLALLLGFSFAASSARFTARQELVVQEANAIGTAFYRADLLPEPQRGTLRELLLEYARARVSWYGEFDSRRADAEARLSGALHAQLWDTALRGLERAPQASLLVVPALNAMYDVHSAHLAAVRRHLPGILLAVLGGCSLVAIATVGYGCGLTGRRNTTFTVPLAVLVASVLWLVIDLDYPRAGLVRITQDPLLDALAAMEVSMGSPTPRLAPSSPLTGPPAVPGLPGGGSP